MPKPKLVVEVQGGVVTDVFFEDEEINLEVEVRDYDAVEYEEESDEEGEGEDEYAAEFYDFSQE